MFFDKVVASVSKSGIVSIRWPMILMKASYSLQIATLVKCAVNLFALDATSIMQPVHAQGHTAR